MYTEKHVLVTINVYEKGEQWVCKYHPQSKDTVEINNTDFPVVKKLRLQRSVKKVMLERLLHWHERSPKKGSNVNCIS